MSSTDVAEPATSAAATTAAAEPMTPLDHAKACWARIQPSSPVYSFFFRDIEITHATHGFISARLPVSANLLNSKNGLHGSVSATLVDWAGGIAIASTGLARTGVSTDIHVSYVSSAKAGDVLTVEGKVSRIGRTMAFTTVTVYKGEGEGEKTGDGNGDATERAVVAHGTHTKYVARDQQQQQQQDKPKSSDA